MFRGKSHLNSTTISTDLIMMSFLLILSLFTPAIAQVPPGIPVINAPGFVVENNLITLTCSSTGGVPNPAVIWYRGSINGILVDNTATTINGVTINSYTLTATRNDHRVVFECQVNNTVLREVLTSTWFFDVYTQPNQPTLSGSATVILGSSNQWTCRSTGGNPAPIITMRIGNIQFTNGITQTSVRQPDNTYITTSILTWTPNLFNNGQILYCDVSHPQTLGSSLQTSSLQLTVNAKPNDPSLTGPSVVIYGSTFQWTCTSTGGRPLPTMTLRIGGRQFNTEVTQTSSLQPDNTYTVVGVLRWAPNITDHGQIIHCDIQHQETGGNNLQSDSITLSVNAEPNNPVITGPTTVISGSTQQWSCVSTGGNPEAEITFRIDNNQFTSGVTKTSVPQADNTYTVISLLSWAPSLSNVGQTLYCDVRHQETRGNNLQTTSLNIIINAEPNDPILTGPTTVIAGSIQQWSCVSTGGNPEAEVTFRISNNQLTSGVTKTSVRQSDNTYTVTSVLSWAPSLNNVDQKLNCDVRHQETRGNNLQTTSLNLTINVEPNQPTLTGPSSITFGSTDQWTCISTGGKPAPIMTLRIGNTPITTGVTQNSVLQSDSTYTVTSVLSWAPTAASNGQTLYCEVQHEETRGSNLQRATLQLTLTVEPNQPTLSGPSSVTTATTNQWTCISTGGLPAPTINMRIGSTEFTTGITRTSAIQSDNTYTVTAVLSWEPNFSHNGKRLYCDVQHQETRGSNLQTVGLQLTVNVGPSQPTLTGPATVTRGSLNQWTCVSTGGRPAPIVTFRIGVSTFTTGVTQTAVLQTDNTYTVTAVLSWAPDLENDDQTLNCDVRPQEIQGSTLQSVSITLNVDDPLSVIVHQTSYQQNIGSQVILNCSVTGTVTSLQWFFNNQEITISGSTKYLNGNPTNPSLTITNIESSDTGSYYCRASNAVNTVVSEIITLSIQDTRVGATMEEDDTALSSGEVAAIILAILFFILFIVVVVFCCCQGFCATLFTKNKEKVTIQPSKPDIPVFHEKPVEYSRPYKKPKKQRKSTDYYIEKYVVLKPEDTVEFRGSRPLTTSDIYVKNRSPRGESFYVPAEEYTFDEEERRRRRLNKRKSSRRRERTNDFTDIETTHVKRISSTRHTDRDPVRTPRNDGPYIAAELEPDE